jgi:hypothetical protein
MPDAARNEREELTARRKKTRAAPSISRIEVSSVRKQADARGDSFRDETDTANHGRTEAEAARLTSALSCAYSEREELQSANRNLVEVDEKRSEELRRLRDYLNIELGRSRELEVSLSGVIHALRQELVASEAVLQCERSQVAELKTLLAAALSEREGFRKNLLAREVELARAREELAQIGQARAFLEDRRYSLEIALLSEQSRAKALDLELERALQEVDTARSSEGEAKAVLAIALAQAKDAAAATRGLAELRDRLQAELAETEQCRIKLNESLRDSESNYAKVLQSHELARSEASRLTDEAIVLRTDLEGARRCVEGISLVVVHLSLLNVEERARANRSETVEAAYRASKCDREQLAVTLDEARNSLAGAVIKAEEERRRRESLETKVGDLQRMADAVAMDLGAAEDRAERNSREVERVRKLATLLATERDQLAAERDRLLDLHHQHLAPIGVATAPARDLSIAADSTVGIGTSLCAALPKEQIATIDHLLTQWSAAGFRRFRSRHRH